MRRMYLLLAVTGIVFPLLLGCGQAPAPNDDRTQGQPTVKATVKTTPVNGEAKKVVDGDQLPLVEPALGFEVDPKHEKYEAALLDALNLLADKKFAQALGALEVAKSFKDTEYIRAEIEKLKTRIDQLAAAERAAQDIQSILAEGKALEAAQLATLALQQYGGSDAAEDLTKLKLQADALSAAHLTDDAARHKRFRDEGQAALKESNLRAAAMAFEQALQFGEDKQLRQQHQEIQARLAKYDDNRRKAAELRRDASSLEDALALLREAAQAWDTLQVRQEIDEYTLALENRRDRASVADFEVRGDIGIPAAGRTIADELLPHLKARFDLVERGQLAQLINDLKLNPEVLAADDQQQRELGQVAKLRYLVVGSVTRLGGITVNARLVDVRTGLIVQTAKVVAPTPEEMITRLPELAKLLQMSDEQRLDYEQHLAKQAQKPAAAPVDAPLPPPPEVPMADQPLPPPEIIENAPPPGFGGLRIDEFAKLPLAPPDGQPLPPPVDGGEAEVLVKLRLLYTSLSLGDNLFRRGRYHEAYRHFEFALILAPDNWDIRIRLERCRSLLPPPVVVVFPPPPPRPRIAIIDFVVSGDPRLVPPGLSSWTPQHLAPYLYPHYEVVDRGEVYWYMGRMGMTVRDLMVDPHARRWLGRALNVRYFVLGTIHETASFDVNTYLVDGEYGWLYGRGRVHVRNPGELRLRLSELAYLTRLRPAEEAIYVRQNEAFQGLLVKARFNLGTGNFQISIGFYQEALRLRPGNVEVLVLLQHAEHARRQAELEAARRRDFLRAQAEAEAFRRRQLDLARAAEATRILAAQHAASLSEQQRRLLEEQRLRDQALAHTQLVTQARIAFKTQNFQLSIQLFDSALRVRPDDAIYRELALARAESERRAQLRAAEDHALRETLLRKQREAELALARKQLEEERLRRKNEETVQRKAQESLYQQYFDEGQRLLNKEKYDPAIAAFQAARRVKKTEAVEVMLNQALVGQAKALAQAKGDQARKELERQLAEEKLRRQQAELAAKRNHELYQQALALAQKALAGKQYELAISKYHEAAKIHRSDVVLTGLKQAEAGRDQALAAAAGDKQKQIEEQQRLANFQRFMKEGNAALAAKDFDKAVKAFRAANKLAPNDVDAFTGLSKAEQAHAQSLADARRLTEEKGRDKTFQRLLESGEASLKNKQYDAAVIALSEALNLKPGDKKALALRATAENERKAAGASAEALAQAKKKGEAYQRVMSEGRLALSNRQYDAAIKAFGEAQKLLPGDTESANFLKDAQKAKADAATGAAAEAKRRAEELQRTAQVKKALSDGRSALAAGNLKAAADAFAVAATLAPQDAEVQRALQDLRRAEDAVRADAAVRQKRLEQYQALLKAGQNALAAKQYDAAVRAFSDASALMPGDKAGLDLLRQAEKARTEAKTAADLALKQQQAEKERAERVRQLLATGQAALKMSNFDAAAKAFAEAQKLAPKDADVTRALQDLDQARRAADTARKTAERVQQLVQQAQKALKAGQLDAAGKALGEASKLAPKDAAVVRTLQELDQARRAADAEADKMKRAAAYKDALSEGEKALAGKRYDEAIKAFNAALKLMPGDPAAARALKDATQAWDAAKKTPPPTKAKEEYQKQLQSAQSLEKQQKYAEAVKAYDEALKLFPKDGKATDGRKYANHMADGHQQLSAKQFKEAIREFEAALQVRPNDPPAASALKKAKAGKK